MSSSTPDLVLSKPRVRQFFNRNDLLIYVNNELFFGFRSGPNVNWGNLCSCMSTVLAITRGYSPVFSPRPPSGSADEMIEWSLQTRERFGDYKAYDLLVSLPGQSPHHPRPKDLVFLPIQPRPRVRSSDNTPRKTPARTPSEASATLVTPSTPPGSAPGNTSSQILDGGARTSPLARTTTTEITSLPSTRPTRSGSSGVDARSERNTRRAAGIPSPAQNRARASKAPQRCWEAYRQCCITGRAQLVDEDIKKPADIDAAHIFPYAYHNLWVSERWSEDCMDRGPEENCSHDYTGYYQMCCLNNMIPLRADVHRLWDVYEIGIDIHDDNRIISFSQGHADLAAFRLRVDHLPQQLRPLPALLTDHLAQGVYLWCLFPESQHASCQYADALDSVVESLETPLTLEEKPREEELLNLSNYLSSHMGYLSLGSGSEEQREPLEMIQARAEINRFKSKQREHGEGKTAFENYLTVALSFRDTASGWEHGGED